MKRILFAILAACLLSGCAATRGIASSNSLNQASQGTVDLSEVLASLYVTEDNLGLRNSYASTKEIRGAAVDPDLVGSWIMADGSVEYVFNSDGTATAATNFAVENDFTFTCLKIGNHNIIAEDLVMLYSSSEESASCPVVSYDAYVVSDNVLYLAAVDSSFEYANQSITQVLVFYKEGASNAVSVKSFYGDWMYGDNDEGRLVIDENGLIANGKTYPVVYTEGGTLIVGGTEYSVSLAYERLFDKGEANFLLLLSYNGKDNKDKPGLSKIMDNPYGNYYSISAKRSVD